MKIIDDHSYKAPEDTDDLLVLVELENGESVPSGKFAVVDCLAPTAQVHLGVQYYRAMVSLSGPPNSLAWCSVEKRILAFPKPWLADLSPELAACVQNGTVVAVTDLSVQEALVNLMTSRT